MTTQPIAELFLSRILLNPRSRQVLKEITSPYEMHRTLMRAFRKGIDVSASKARRQFDVLFRVEILEHERPVTLYVQSSIRPDWAFLDNLHNYLWSVPGVPAYECKDISPAYKKIKTGQVFRFRLRANPTKRIGAVIKGDVDLKGKRVGLLTEKEQLAWLERKGRERERGKPGGFEIVLGRLEPYAKQSHPVPCIDVQPENKFRSRINRDGRSIETTHLAVCFNGLLRITDADAFRETLVRGIGSGKAFGFGLLSIVPV